VKKIIIFLASLSFCFFISGYYSNALAEEETSHLSQKAENLREKYLSLNESSISLEKEIIEMISIGEISSIIKKDQKLRDDMRQLRKIFMDDQNDFPRFKADLMDRNYQIMSDNSLAQEINYLEKAIKTQKDFFISIGTVKNMLENIMIKVLYKKNAKSKRLQPNAAFF
jgi:hypothetical protein